MKLNVDNPDRQIDSRHPVAFGSEGRLKDMQDPNQYAVFVVELSGGPNSRMDRCLSVPQRGNGQLG
jgi:hypothetical protein